MSSPHLRLAPLVGALTLAACAHSEFESSDPATEVARRIEDITSAEGEVVCAAQRVDSQRMVAALFGIHTTVEGKTEPAIRSGPRIPTRSGPNLSQISAAAAGALAGARQANGETGGLARYRQRTNEREFDRYMNLATRQVRPGMGFVRGAGVRTSLEERGAAADYSTVWLEYFYRRDVGVEAGGILEWLRSRSQTDLEALRSYHDAFREALEVGCNRG
jgi:hypothetical protein